MKRIVDTLSGDLFASIPKAQPMTAGSWRVRSEIAHVMGDAVKAWHFVAVQRTWKKE
ncbi:MAG: hypothetical protein Q8Q57_10005 [Methylotenera sp.]|nr:hypothetical protein [Methylococcaceae bacterium]MDP3819313.1 hypothetical protein [Methylotenera sp.]